RSDHGDDIPAALRDGEPVHDVLIHVPGGGQYIAQRRRALAEALAQRATLAHPHPDLLQAPRALGDHALADRLVRGARYGAQIEPLGVDFLGDPLSGALAVEHRVAEPVRDPEA